MSIFYVGISDISEANAIHIGSHFLDFFLYFWHKNVCLKLRMSVVCLRTASTRCWCDGRQPIHVVHVANMGPTWVLSSPGGPHVGPTNLAMRDTICRCGGQPLRYAGMAMDSLCFILVWRWTAYIVCWWCGGWTLLYARVAEDSICYMMVWRWIASSIYWCGCRWPLLC